MNTDRQSGRISTIRERLKQAAQQSGKTQEEIGLAMGLSKTGARQAVSRLLNLDINYDPRLSTLLSFASAVGVDLQKLI